MSESGALTSSAQLYQGALSATVTRFLTGAPIGPGDWTYQGDIGGVQMAAIRGMFAYVVDFLPGMGRYLGYHDPLGLGNFDEFPDSFAQIVVFENTRDGEIIPTAVERMVRRQQFFPLVFSDIASIGIHVQPGVQLQLVGFVLPSLGA